MCFWATRYDCFADEKEYRLGGETIRRLLLEIEKELQEDRRVAQDFDWKLIEGNVNLPYPYIVSFTARPDNEYMWDEYAKDEGVVLETVEMCIKERVAVDDALTTGIVESSADNA